MELKEIIIKKIKNEGVISFRDFMEMALYYPGLGYYTSEKEKFGKTGDYYTSPLLSNVYGHMIGMQLEEMWQIMDRAPLNIVEYGAGSGALSFDILAYLKKNTSLYEHLNYYIIEKSIGMREKQQKILYEKVQWINHIDDLPGFSGCVISNEVVDNFSVHLVVMKEELMEIFIDYIDGFVEVLKPSSKEIKDYFSLQNIDLPRDYRTEVNLEACKWIEEIATNLTKGFVITIDYGYPAGELYSPERKTGTLTCYHQHETNFAPYINIGVQDITAHVNFSALHLWGKAHGLEYTGFCNQYYFLHSMGLSNHLRKLEQEISADRATFFQVYQLLMEMGSKFKVLIQHKGVNGKVVKGMQFTISEESIVNK